MIGIPPHHSSVDRVQHPFHRSTLPQHLHGRVATAATVRSVPASSTESSPAACRVWGWQVDARIQLQPRWVASGVVVIIIVVMRFCMMMLRMIMMMKIVMMTITVMMGMRIFSLSHHHHHHHSYHHHHHHHHLIIISPMQPCPTCLTSSLAGLHRVTPLV